MQELAGRRSSRAIE